jgi:uncharacterized protein YbjT (DUF2867 family)
MDMKIFVTGATGFVGMHVTNELLAGGFEVYAGARDVVKVSRILGKQVVPVSVEFSDRDSISKALMSVRPDVVVHLIGIIAEIPSKGITFDNVHFGIPRDLYEASRKAGVGKVVHMSALGVHPDAPSRYHKSKLLAEQELRRSGMTYTIFRPSVIIGPEQKLFFDIKKITDLVPIVALPAGGSHLMQPVDVRDVACAFASAVTKGETDNSIYELCGPDVISFRKILEATFVLWKKKVLYLSMPKRVMALAGRVAESIMDNPPVTSDLVRMMWKDNVCGLYGDAQLGGVRAVCGREPVPFAESIKWSLGQ